LKGTDIRSVIFSGFGEPLLHKRAVDCIARLRADFKRRIQLNTNGSLLTREVSAGLVGAELDVLNLSYNGPAREEYKRVMVGMSFEKLAENVRGFLEVRGKNARPLLSLQSSTAETKAQKDVTLGIGASLGAEVVRFYGFNNRAGYLWEEAETNTVPLARRFCYRMLFVAWDGTIYPCSHDIKARQPLGNVCLGPLDTGQKRDYPLCVHCSICNNQGLKSHKIWRNVLRYKLRRLVSQADS
jgi:hypothetical protein